MATLEEVHAGLGVQLGSGAAIAFGVALLASGLAASAVGTYAGQVIMAGFLKRRIPLLARRLITVFPALLILLSGADPTQALVWSQVVLSFGIPFALVPLVYLTSRKELMGDWVNRPGHHCRRVCGGGADHRSQRVPAGEPVHRLTRPQPAGSGPGSIGRAQPAGLSRPG